MGKLVEQLENLNKAKIQSRRTNLLNGLQKSIKMAETFSRFNPEQRQLFLNELSDEEILLLEYDWYVWARPTQRLPATEFRIWLIQAGRGFGKTRTGAETIRLWKDLGFQRFALVGITPSDARDVMILGESGLINICPPWDKPEYQPTRRRVVWNDGSVAYIFSGANPEQLRGPQHEKAWCDEIFAWQYPKETWDMLMFGLRLGSSPQAVVTSTPKPFPLLKELRASPTTHITHGTTYENSSNLAPSFFSEIVSKYEGSRLGRQEINAEILDDNPNALWSRDIIDQFRIRDATPDLHDSTRTKLTLKNNHLLPDFKRIIISVDPATTSNPDTSNETGIIVAALGANNHAYVLEDLTLKGKPIEWANQAIAAYHRYMADRLVAEANNGGDMIEFTISSIDKKVAFKKVHATKGKYTRAEPVSTLYEQGKVHHVGYFGLLEDQLCEWEPGSESPDRLDALVWAITELMLNSTIVDIIIPGSNESISKYKYTN